MPALGTTVNVGRTAERPFAGKVEGALEERPIYNVLAAGAFGIEATAYARSLRGPLSQLANSRGLVLDRHRSAAALAAVAFKAWIDAANADDAGAAE